MDFDLILASASPRRRRLLERVGYRLQVVPADVDESVHDNEEPITYVRRLATSKAKAVPGGGVPVVAADTTVFAGGIILGKPGNPAEAGHMLRSLSDTEHSVVTGFCVELGDRQVVDHVATRVRMRALDESDVEGYVASGEWRGKAGGYAVQGIAAAFVSGIEGSITNVIGLPLAEVVTSIEQVGGPRPRYAEGVCS